jgi:hypothetical protein
MVWTAGLIGVAAICVAQTQSGDKGDVRIETDETGKVRVMVKGAADATKAYHDQMVLRTLVDDSSERLDVDVKNETVREALKNILEKAKQPYVVDEDVPSDVRVTIVAKNVRLRAAVDLIADAAGIGWRKELDGAKMRFRFGKSIKSWSSARALFGDALPGAKGLHDVLVEPLKDGVMWRAFAGSEQRSTMTCPHCKAVITRAGERTTPKCPKCSNEFRLGWKVCPYDGTKRPDAQGEWRFCPVCGKGITDKPKAD